MKYGIDSQYYKCAPNVLKESLLLCRLTICPVTLGYLKLPTPFMENTKIYCLTLLEYKVSF